MWRSDHLSTNVADLVSSFHVLLWLEFLAEGMSALLWVSISKIALLLSPDSSTGDGFVSESEKAWQLNRIPILEREEEEKKQEVKERRSGAFNTTKRLWAGAIVAMVGRLWGVVIGASGAARRFQAGEVYVETFHEQRFRSEFEQVEHRRRRPRFVDDRLSTVGVAPGLNRSMPQKRRKKGHHHYQNEDLTKDDSGRRIGSGLNDCFQRRKMELKREMEPREKKFQETR